MANDVSPTRFTPEELKLISRALNFYAEHPEYMSDERAFGTECEDSSALATRIYRENFRIGMENERPKYREGHKAWCTKEHALWHITCEHAAML